MKLLTQTQVKDLKSAELTRDILRVKETDEQVRRVNARLASAEADFATVLARHRREWADEELSHDERLREMDAEIRVLEDRKKQALIPLEVYKVQADTLLKEAKYVLDSAKEREEEAQRTLFILENRLDDVSEREIDVGDAEASLEKRKKGIEAQEEQTKMMAAQLSHDMQVFYEKRDSEEMRMVERRKEIQMAEITVDSKIEKVKRDIEANRLYEIRLKDERATLDRIIKRNELSS